MRCHVHAHWNGCTFPKERGTTIHVVPSQVVPYKSASFSPPPLLPSDPRQDAVNTASRMESTGVVGATQVTERIFHLLKGSFAFTARGPVEVKGKGLLCTWLHWPREEFGVKRSSTTASDFEPPVMAAEVWGPPMPKSMHSVLLVF